MLGAVSDSPATPTGKRQTAILRRSVSAAGRALMLLVCCAFLIGFAAFVAKVELSEPAQSAKAEGVVALTGGAERISDAVNLLATGHANRLLITGVNQTTTRAEISHLLPRYRALFTCCVDLGYQALNTVGNAAETRAWVREHGMRSVIVVTSNYHMPRALVELGSTLPTTELVPYPVVSDRQKANSFWSDGKRLRLLAVEYVKYLAAVARTHFVQTTVDDPPVAVAAGGTWTR
jgi:uncharacterized SAM-binding protein YcdF (DUF218 family)